MDTGILTARNVGRSALLRLQAVGQPLKRPDLPREEEIDPLSRGMPRFEITLLPSNIEIGLWGFWEISIGLPFAERIGSSSVIDVEGGD